MRGASGRLPLERLELWECGELWDLHVVPPSVARLELDEAAILELITQAECVAHFEDVLAPFVARVGRGVDHFFGEIVLASCSV